MYINRLIDIQLLIGDKILFILILQLSILCRPTPFYVAILILGKYSKDSSWSRPNLRSMIYVMSPVLWIPAAQCIKTLHPSLNFLIILSAMSENNSVFFACYSFQKSTWTCSRPNFSQSIAVWSFSAMPWSVTINLRLLLVMHSLNCGLDGLPHRAILPQES